MVINWYGEACFLLEAGGLRIMTDLPSKDSGLTPPRFKTDILIFSKTQEFRDFSEGTFVIAGPGEYEVKGVEILGLNVLKNGQTNTIYSLDFDGLKIAYLGFLAGDLDSSALEFLEDPDLVFLPVGGQSFLDASSAVNLMNKIEPRIVIPMLYSIKGLKRKAESLGDFLKESGTTNSSQAKLILKKKDLGEGETKIVILEAS